MAALNLCEAREIPVNWQRVSLSEFRKQKSETIEPSKFPTETFELYSVPSLETGRPEVVQGKEIGSNKQIVSRQDVLLSKINPRLSRSWIVRGFTEHETIASTEWIVFEKSPAILSGFLKNFLAQYSIRDFLASNASGVGGSLTRVKPSIVDGIEFGLPPLAEQQRIVAKLEELFSELDKGVENLRTAQQQLKVYRQALLKHAFEGKLTAEWRAQNPDKQESAEALLARIQQEREARYRQQHAEWQEAQQAWEAAGKTGSKPTKPKAPKVLPALTAEELAELPELPESWRWVRIGEAFGVYVGATPSRSNQSYWGGAIPWVSSGEVAFCRIKSTKERITDSGYFNASTEIHPAGTVVLAMIGEGKTRGQAAILDVAAAHNQNTAAIRVSESGCAPAFLYFYLCLQYEVTRKLGSGNNQKALNKERVSDMKIPFFSLAEQQALVQLVDEKLSVIEQLEKTITTSLQQAEALRQSILKKAFSGQLVPQDPDDEPASVLLERIRAERAAQQPAPRRGRPRRASA